MGSIPNPKPGDWLEHEVHSHRLGTKLAEIIGTTDRSVSFYLQGEPGYQNVPRSDITRWWSIFVPPTHPDDVTPPPWIEEGREFYVSRAGKEYRAVVRVVRGTWVSYIEECPDFRGVFRLVSYREFRDMGWDAQLRPTVWEWLRRPAV